MTRDPRIDAYIAKAQPFAQPILQHIRALAHRALPDAEETLKWGVPHFTVKGKNAVGMAAFKTHASVMIASEDSAGGGMGSLGKLANLSELPTDDELIERFKASAKAVLAGKPKQAKTRPKPKIPVPDDFAKALADTSGAAEIFAGFTDAQRRDYLEWITDAKRDSTRAKRIVTAAEWIGEGKRRNWKYENC